MTRELPAGWSLCRLDELAAPEANAITDGPFGSNLKTEHYTLEGPRVIRLQNVGDGEFIDEEAHIAPAHYDRLRKHEAVAGDVVVAALGETLPRACVVPPALGPAIVKADCPRLRPSPEINADFLVTALNSPLVREQAAAVIAGIGRPRLNLGKIKALRIPLPPRAEQDRIASVVARRLEEIAAGRVALREAARGLTALRIAVLSDALAGDWPLVPLGRLLVSLRNGFFVSRPAKEPPGVAIFRISAVRPLLLNVDDIRFARIDPEACSGYFVEEGDLLFTRYSGNAEYVGNCTRVPELAQPTLHPDKLIRGVVDRELADPAYVELACAAGVTLAEIRARRKTTAGQVGIAGSQLKTVPVPLPPIEAQRRIVAAAQGRLREVANLQGEIERAEQMSNDLVRALRQSAILGALVEQRAGDEPASELLARIKEANERFSVGARSAKKPRRRTKVA